MALRFEGVEEIPHFDKTSFRFRKMIFATLHTAQNRACLKLSEIQQDLFLLADASSVSIVPNSWGKLGWTYFYLDTVRKTIMAEALESAYTHVAGKVR